MPFDGTDFPPPRKPPGRATWNGGAFPVLTVILVSCLFLAPIVIAVLVDCIKFMHGH